MTTPMISFQMPTAAHGCPSEDYPTNTLVAYQGVLISVRRLPSIQGATKRNHKNSQSKGWEPAWRFTDAFAGGARFSGIRLCQKHLMWCIVMLPRSACVDSPLYKGQTRTTVRTRGRRIRNLVVHAYPGGASLGRIHPKPPLKPMVESTRS